MNVNVLGICGSPVKGGNTELLLQTCLESALSCGGVSTLLITLSGKRIADCKHCNWCTTRQEQGKFCSQHDDMTDIYPELLKADAVVLASPVYIGRASGYMDCMLDRLRCLLLGTVYRGSMRNKTGAALSVGWGRNLGVETTLLSLITSLLMMEMIPVGPLHGTSSTLGIAGLASEGGSGKFKPSDKHGILHDELALKGAQSLGKRIVEITRLLKS
jgi:multimeric flavodoxin WrbA